MARHENKSGGDGMILNGIIIMKKKKELELISIWLILFKRRRA